MLTKISQLTPLQVGRSPTGKAYLTLYQATVEKGTFQFPYFFVARGDKLDFPPNKRPDAVIVVAINPLPDPCVVLINEFRPPLNGREISFPAGIIDPEDYANTESVQQAIERAAVREFQEETGMDLVIVEVSPLNIYSSAGLTNESAVYVFGYASGSPSSQHLEQGEDIEVILANREKVDELLAGDVPFSRAAWPFLWFFRRLGVHF